MRISANKKRLRSGSSREPGNRDWNFEFNVDDFSAILSLLLLSTLMKLSICKKFFITINLNVDFILSFIPEWNNNLSLDDYGWIECDIGNEKWNESSQ